MRRVAFLVIGMSILLVPATASAQNHRERRQAGGVRIVETASPRLRAAMREAVRQLKLDEPVPYQQYKSAIADSLHGLEPDVEYGQSPTPSPEPMFAYCLPYRYPISSTGLCLEGRFIVTAIWDNPFDAAGFFPAYGVHLTTVAGYLWFLDPSNPEVVIKEINGCYVTNPSTHWIFAAGLTNFAVQIQVLDIPTGITRQYSSASGQTFTTIIDQQTPFPCP